MRGVREVYKCIQHPLLHFVRVHCLASMAMTPWGYENNRFPLHNLMSSLTISHHLTIFFLVPKDRQVKERENERKKLGIEFP
jgi:hypothetical protein